MPERERCGIPSLGIGGFQPKLHHSIVLVLVLVLVLVSARDMAFQDLELVGSNPIASAMADNKEEAAFR